MSGQRIGPYRLVASLGTGGMGEVFKAYDDRLGRWVAIKRIRSDQSGLEEDSRERLRREARAVAPLSHPAIVRVYDIFRDGDSDCIVMEFVEGEPLDRLLDGKGMPPLRAAAIAYDVASGLAEAHSKGVVHRDLKTENVMVTPEGQAKILDFGLAKPLAAHGLEEAALTGKGQLVGTSRAMPPEYVGGGEVDARADLFSLGVLLYETLTGDSPFKAHNTLATLKKVLVHRPPPVAEVVPTVPQELSDLVQRLLAKEPSDRPPNARAVVDELGAIVARGSSGAVERPSSGAELLASSDRLAGTLSATPTTEVFARPRWRAWVAPIVAVVLLAAVAGGYWAWSGGGTGFDFTERDRIVIGDFQNATGEPLLDDSLAVAFRLGLEQSRYAVVVPETEIRAVLARMERPAETPIDRQLGVEICQREGAKALVLGSIVELGGEYSLSAEVIDPATGANVFTVPPVAAGDRARLFPALERVARTVRANLGESLAQIRQTTRPLEKVTTPDLRALQRYSRGVSALAEGRHADAVVLLEGAIEIDPGFAMAHAKLGLLHNTRDPGSAVAWHHLQRALAESDRLTELEKLYVEGWVANLRGSPEEMARRWSRMRSLFPSQAEGYHNLGIVYWMYGNRFADAAAEFTALLELPTSSQPTIALRHLAYCELALGRHEEALAHFERAWELEPSSLTVSVADAYVVTGRHEQAAKTIEAALASSSPEMRRAGRRRGALALADRGELRSALGAVRELQADLAPELEPGDALAAIALAELLGDETALAGAVALVVRRAADLLAGETSAASANLAFLSTVGKVAARNGLVEEARVLLGLVEPAAAASGFPIWRAYVRVLAAEVAAAEGRTATAVAELEAALTEVELYQAHESLARVHERAGDLVAAAVEYRWIVERRGRAFAECVELCGIQVLSALDWARSLVALGRVQQARGEREDAIAAYRRLLDHWRGGDAVPLRVEAGRGLEALASLPAARLAPGENGVKSSPRSGPEAGGPQAQIAMGLAEKVASPSSRSMRGSSTAAVKTEARSSAVAARAKLWPR